MKRALLISLFICASLLSFAQSRLFDRNIEWAASSTINKVIALSDGSWVSGGRIGDCSQSLLLRRAANGDTIWSRGFSLGIIHDIEQGKNGLIYIAGDYAGSGAFVLIYDTTGTLVDYHYFITYNYSSTGPSHSTLNSSWASEASNQLAIIDSQNIFIASGTYLVKINVDTWTVAWSQLFNAHINDILFDNNRVYLATATDLVETDTSGNILHSLTQNGVWDSYKSLSGKNYFINHNGVYSVDSTLAILSNYTLNQQFTNWQGITGSYDNVYISGKSISGNTFNIAVFDSSLNYLRQFPLQQQCNLPSSIVAKDSIINISINYFDTIAFPITSNVVYRATNSTCDIIGNSSLSQSKMDLASTEVNKFHTTFLRLQPVGNDYADFYQVDMTVAIILKNTGSDIIKNFSIQSDVYDGLNCTLDYYFNNMSNLNLAPGDSITLYDSTFNGYSFQQYWLLYRSYYIISINGAKPNANCEVPSITTTAYEVTSIPELTPTPTFHIYPNPATNILNIQTSEATNATIYLSDLTGRILLEKSISQGNNQVDIGILSSGLYIYTIKEGKHNPMTGKIEKQ